MNVSNLINFMVDCFKYIPFSLLPTSLVDMDLNAITPALEMRPAVGPNHIKKDWAELVIIP